MKSQGIMVERLEIIGTFNSKIMSKKTIYIIISVVLVIILALLFSYYLLAKNPDGSTPSVNNVFKNFFPFGGDPVTNNDGTPSDNNDDTPPPVTTDFTQKLRKITSEQVAGAGLVDVKAGSVLRYIERATGHIYEVELFSPRAGRISNTTIPNGVRSFLGQ
jgi:hypothetical protein